MTSNPLFGNERACAAKAWLDDRLAVLEKKKASIQPTAKRFSPEYAVLKRIQAFRFSEYPDYTAPWHLLQWPHMRWLHVYYVLRIFETLKQAKGGSMGKPIVIMPFQALMVLCILGPEDPDTKLRLVREGLLTMSRKNAKTSLIAGLVTALMALDRNYGGFYGQEIYVGAADRPQAGITFDIVTKYILQDRELGLPDLFRMVPSLKHMTHKHTLTEFKVLSSDAYRAHGLNPALVIFDETGNIPANLAEDFYSVLTSGYGAQPEPLTLLLSTQAATDAHLFSQMVDRCKRINAGEEESRDFAGFVFETPDEIGGKKLDPYAEQWWYLSNPGLGVSPSLEDMRSESKKAQDLPSLESKFRNLRLNQRANPYNPLISKTLWQRNAGPVEYEALYGRKCWGALDLSSVRDLTALVLVFEADDEDGPCPVLPFFWLPQEGLEQKEAEDKVPYLTWVRQGFIDAQSHKIINYELVAAQIETAVQDFDVQALGFDRWRVADLQVVMRERGLGALADDENFFFAIGQGFKDASPCVEALEKAVYQDRLAHGGHPVLQWNASNAVVVRDPAGNRKFDKARSYNRIDGIVALAMALRVRELQAQKDDGPSAFENDDCLI